MQVRYALLYAGLLLAALAALVGGTGQAAANGTLIEAQTALRINEFMTDNESTWIDPDDPGLDEYPDWIELYNTSNQAVPLTGLYFTDDPTLPAKFAITASLSIPANGYVIFYADDEEEDEGPYHLGFRLTKNNGYIGLFTGQADNPTLVDEISYGDEKEDISTGRLPDGSGSFQKLFRPSPGRSNLVTSPTISAVTRTPDLPTASAPVQVSAIITDDGSVSVATIVYTVNGGASREVAMTEVEDDRFTGQIPAQPNGSVVEFTLRAVDNSGKVTPDLSFELPYVERYVVGYNVPNIRINELMPENYLGLEDPDDPGDYPDWIELYNASDRVVSLDGLYFADRLADGQPDIDSMEAISDGLTIPPRGYVLFYADRDPEQGPFHLDFRLNRNGEAVALYGALGTVEIDSIEFPNVPIGVAYGRNPDASNEWTFLYCNTPGAANRLCDQQVFMPSISR